MPGADSYSTVSSKHKGQYLMSATQRSDSTFTMYAIVPLWDFNRSTDKGILPMAHLAFSQRIIQLFAAGFRNFVGMI